MHDSKLSQIAINPQFLIDSIQFRYYRSWENECYCETVYLLYRLQISKISGSYVLTLVDVQYFVMFIIIRKLYIRYKIMMWRQDLRSTTNENNNSGDYPRRLFRTPGGYPKISFWVSGRNIWFWNSKRFYFRMLNIKAIDAAFLIPIAFF